MDQAHSNKNLINIYDGQNLKVDRPDSFEEMSAQLIIFIFSFREYRRILVGNNQASLIFSKV